MKSAHELLREYREYVGESEASVVLHRWSFIGTLSANLGRRVEAAFGHLRFQPNEYFIIIGEPASRKSTAIKQARKVLELSGFNKFAASQTSKEQFYQDLQLSGELELDSHSQLYICAPELNNFLGESNKGFITALMELYDSDDKFDARFKNSKSTTIPYPCVSLLGGNTQANFAACFPPQVVSNGFLSRLLLVHGDTTGIKLPWGGKVIEGKEKKLTDHLLSIRENISGKLHYTPQAMKALERIYESWPDLDDSRFAYYNQRRYTHLLKLCVILCASGGTLLLTEDCVVLANTLLDSIESNFTRALGEFGKSRYSEEGSAIMELLYASKEPLGMARLWESVQTSVEKYDIFRELIIGLTSSGKIIQKDSGFIAAPPKKRTIEFIDKSLLNNI